MNLSLNKEQMNAFLQGSAGDGAQFSCMLWGMFLNGMAGSAKQAGCYIGCTQECLYIVAVNTFDTSKAVARFAIPFAQITNVSVKRPLIYGRYKIDLDCMLADPDDTELLEAPEDPEELTYPEKFLLRLWDKGSGKSFPEQKENLEYFINLIRQLS